MNILIRVDTKVFPASAGVFLFLTDMLTWF